MGGRWRRRLAELLVFKVNMGKNLCKFGDGFVSIFMD